MYTLLLVLSLFILLDLAALRWGANSLESFKSPEWERRAQRYYGTNKDISRDTATNSYYRTVDNKQQYIVIKEQEKSPAKR